MTTVQTALPQVSGGIVYPESDGEPMADNTRQFEWIVTLKENLDRALPDAFVAGDLLWYPVEGDNRTRRAPDVLVAMGRPKGHRSSYRQWAEAGVAPQVVVEVWSPGNTFPELVEKVRFYDTHGVQEVWLLDPDAMSLSVWDRRDGRLEGTAIQGEWASRLLGVRFVLKDGDIEVYRPDGTRFLTWTELEARADTAEARADTAEARADTAEARASALEARLRELGVDPSTV